jgi:hypothetical protein
MTASVEKSGAEGTGTKKKKAFTRLGRNRVVAKLPILRFGKGNNFQKFKAALLEMALEEYSDLGRLTKQESYYVPPFIAPSCEGEGLTQD